MDVRNVGTLACDSQTEQIRESDIVVISAPRSIDFMQMPLRSIGPNDVLVQTHFTGISHGTEMNVYRGVAPQWDRVYDRNLRLFRPPTEDERAKPARGYWNSSDLVWNYPLAYGYTNVGSIVEIGKDVERLQVGDIVYAYEGHQSAYVAPSSAVIKLPVLSNPAAGVLFANLNTAYGGVLDADIRIDDTVVVFGQGLIGLLVTQLLKKSAASQVFTVDRIAARREMSLRMGASESLDPAVDDIAAAVRERTNGRGADVVIEVSGSYIALQEAIRTAAPNTTVVALSWYGGKPDGLALSHEFHHNRITIKSSQVGGIAAELSATHSNSRRAATILDRMAELDLDPLLTTYIHYTEAARAYEMVDQFPDQIIEVVLTYGDAKE